VLLCVLVSATNNAVISCSFVVANSIGQSPGEVAQIHLTAARCCLAGKSVCTTNQYMSKSVCIKPDIPLTRQWASANQDDTTVCYCYCYCWLSTAIT
jgi:hypothetical protein